MDKKSFNRLSWQFCGALLALGLLSACASKQQSVEPSLQVTQEQLLAYCPDVTLREGTSYYNTYVKNGQDDPEKVVYQAVIRDVTRVCTYTDTSLTMKVAAAGRVIPGPQFKAGNITMPIRVVVLQGDKVLYSKLNKYSVKMDINAQTTQFIFADDQISLPKPTSNDYQVFIGYDVGAK